MEKYSFIISGISRSQATNVYSMVKTQLKDCKFTLLDGNEVIDDFSPKKATITRVWPKATVTIGAFINCTRGPGQWAFIREMDGAEMKKSGRCENATFQSLLLTAMIESVRDIDKPHLIEVQTDNIEFAKPFAYGWVKYWATHEWHKKSGEEVKNKDIWVELCAALLKALPKGERVSVIPFDKNGNPIKLEEEKKEVQPEPEPVLDVAEILPTFARKKSAIPAPAVTPAPAPVHVAAVPNKFINDEDIDENELAAVMAASGFDEEE